MVFMWLLFFFIFSTSKRRRQAEQLAAGFKRFSARLSEVILLYLAVLDYVLYYLLIELAVGENYELLKLLLYYMFFSLVLFVF